MSEETELTEARQEKGRRAESLMVFIWRHRQRGMFVAIAHDEGEARDIAASQGVTWMQHRAVDAVLKAQRGEAWNFRQYG